MKTILTIILGFLLPGTESMAQNTGTRVIAHRGAWKNTGLPENSIAALKQAIALGCYGSEFDVHMSSDSVLFVHHDPMIQSVYLEKTAAAQLETLKLGNGENLPTLETYLRAGEFQQATRLVL